jgi:hypothetical protein
MARTGIIPGRGEGQYTDYDIRLTADGRPVLFTWYKGHAFDGWISNANFRRAEADGVLAWDAEGNPVIRSATTGGIA